MTPNPTRLDINPVYVHRPKHAPHVECCARTSERHLFGCRFWSEAVDHEGFFLETTLNGMSIGNHIEGAHRLGRLLMRLARNESDWRINVLASFGTKPLDVTAFPVKARRF